jgi:diaminopimelate decarboxylase
MDNKQEESSVFLNKQEEAPLNLKPKKKSERKNIPRRYLRARWKHFLSQDSRGNLLIEGISIGQIIKKYGSPVFILVEEEIRKKCRELYEGFDYPFFRPQYACKCNSNLEVLKIMKEEGLDFDASSVGEIILGLLADFTPKQITFTNLYKTKKDILFAAEIGINAITIDSLEEIDTAIESAEQTNKIIPIMLRVNPMIKTGKFSTKRQHYGIPFFQVKEAILKVKEHPLVQLKGFHFHGSYAHNFKSYFLAAKKLVDLSVFAMENGIIIENMDFGGGFPAEAPKNYCPGQYFRPKDFGEKFVPFFTRLCKKKGISLPILIFEPGKSLVANAGIGIVSVISKKKLDKKETIITDGSCYSMFPDVLISHCDYEILPGHKMRTRADAKYDFAGCTCDCLDLIATCQKMPTLNKDDLLVIMDCGAYSSVLSSNFNNLKRPPLVMINNRGETKLIRRRDRYGEIFAPELDVLKVAEKNEMKKFYDLLRKNYP